jgi:putative transposase
MHALARVFGCARVVFNDALRARQEACAAGLPYISDVVMSARLTAAKATPERAWLAEVSSVALQQALADLNAAYRSFFASVSGKRKGPNVGTTAFPVPQGQPSVCAVHRECPVQGAS